MNALTYERRRLAGVRSTGLILVAVLALDAAVAELTVRQAALAEPVRVLTAGVPLLPLPLAALGAGAVGALAYGHEVRYPVLRTLLLPRRRRFALLLAKLAVVGVYSALLALATLAVDTVVLQFAGDADGFLVGLAHGTVPAALGGFVALVVAGGWTGLLGAGLLRSTAAGMLMLVVLPFLVELALLPSGVRRQGLGHLDTLWRTLSTRSAYGPLTGGHGAAPRSSLELAALVVVPVLVLLGGYLLLLSRRRGV